IEHRPLRASVVSRLRKQPEWLRTEVLQTDVSASGGWKDHPMETLRGGVGAVGRDKRNIRPDSVGRPRFVIAAFDLAAALVVLGLARDLAIASSVPLPPPRPPAIAFPEKPADPDSKPAACRLPPNPAVAIPPSHPPTPLPHSFCPPHRR